MDRWIGAMAAIAGIAALCGCSAIGIEGPARGSTLSNILRYGSTTEPPLATKAAVEFAGCPNVLVRDGGSAIRSGSSQVSIADLARECVERPDGSVLVKVGVEGRALLGPSGGAGRFDVPVSFQLTRGDTVLVNRVRRASVSIPSGQAQASFTVVEGDMIVPRGTGDFDIIVGLGGSGASPRGRRG